jgi:hypothetical protein
LFRIDEKQWSCRGRVLLRVNAVKRTCLHARGVSACASLINYVRHCLSPC